MFPQDKDTTLGGDWNERGIIKNSATRLLIDYKNENVTQKPWFKTYHAFTQDIEARYAQLKDDNIFISYDITFRSCKI